MPQLRLHNNALPVIVTALSLLAFPARAAEDIASQITKLSAKHSKQDRIAAARSLQTSDDAEALKGVDSLVAMCKEEDVEVRRAGVVALGLLVEKHEQQCPFVLVEAMMDPDDLVRTNATALVSLVEGRLPPKALAFLLEHADHRDPDLRSNFLTTLSYFSDKDPRVLSVLRQATHDRSLKVRTNAVAALWRVTDDLETVVPHWLEMLEAPTEAAKTGQADDGFPAMAGIAAATLLREMGIQRTQQMITLLIKNTKDESPVIRRAATRTLAAVSTESDEAHQIAKQLNVQQVLTTMLDDPEESVRFDAAAATNTMRQGPRSEKEEADTPDL